MLVVRDLPEELPVRVVAHSERGEREATHGALRVRPLVKVAFRPSDFRQEGPSGPVESTAMFELELQPQSELRLHFVLSATMLARLQLREPPPLLVSCTAARSALAHGRSHAMAYAERSSSSSRSEQSGTNGRSQSADDGRSHSARLPLPVPWRHEPTARSASARGAHAVHKATARSASRDGEQRDGSQAHRAGREGMHPAGREGMHPAAREGAHRAAREQLMPPPWGVSSTTNSAAARQKQRRVIR